LIAAAVASLTAGAPLRAEALLGTLLPGVDAPDQDAAVVKLRANLANLLGRDGVVPLLLEAARSQDDHAAPATRDTLLEALAAVTITKRIGDGLTPRDVARAALDAGSLPADHGPAELLRVGHATLVAVGHDRAAPFLRRALTAGPAQGPGNRGAACLLHVVAALELWDADALGALADGYTALAREEGALRLLQIATYALALHRVLCGRLTAAEETFGGYREVLVAISGDRELFTANDVLLSAWRGDQARTDAAVAVQAGPPVDRPAPAIAQLARWAAMVLAAGQGRSTDAREIGRLVFDEDPPHLLGLVLPDLVEAAVRADDRDTADRALAQLAVRAEVSGTSWALGLLARSRALLARPADAEALFHEAVTLLGKTPVVTDLARAHLVHGEWLRRQRRRTDAREQLRIAHRLFDDMGAVAFAERTRLELLATGERARSRTVPAGPELTPQEARIARLAAGGATNIEIAAGLFLSPNTVEYHLRKVFRKLEVTSRRQLAARLRQ
jgi:DNA-binding CsgD family transcriptional regulator